MAELATLREITYAVGGRKMKNLKLKEIYENLKK